MITKEMLSKQINEMMEDGKEVICLPKFGDVYDFNKFGFSYYYAMSYEEFDTFVYMTDATANLFHDAYSFNSLDFILKLIEEGSFDILETLIGFQVDWATE